MDPDGDKETEEDDGQQEEEGEDKAKGEEVTPVPGTS